MKRGQKRSAEQMVLKLRQIEVQTAQGKVSMGCAGTQLRREETVVFCTVYGTPAGTFHRSKT